MNKRTTRRSGSEAAINLSQKRSWHILISENWADALDPIVRQRFMLGASRRPSLIERLFNVQGSMRSYEQGTNVGALGVDMWNQWENSGTVGQADFDQGYKTTFTHKEYPLDVVIQRKLLADQMWNEVFNIPTQMGDSAALKREVDAASVFNNAFSASFVGGDAVALCSDSHPYSPQKTGTTQDNNYALALNQDNLETIAQAMMAFTDDNGNKMAVTPNILLVPIALRDQAHRITASAQVPGSANNDANLQASLGWQVITWHYLTDTNAWFVIDGNLMKQSLLWFNREPLTINPKVEDKTLVATWRAYMRYSFGFSDWRWVAGSNPS